jgi:hypothetical protein
LAYDDNAFDDVSKYVAKSCNDAYKEANKFYFISTAYGSQFLLGRRGRRRGDGDGDYADADEEQQ